MIQKWQYFESNLILSERESQIIIGTLLGTSSIVFPEKSKNPHLLMRSIKKNPTWIRCKAFELKKLSRPKSFIEDKYYYRWNSSSTELFKKYYNIFYNKGSKQISFDLLESLKPLSIACWFLDKGFINEHECGFKLNYYEKSLENILHFFKSLNMPLYNKNNYYIFKEKNNVISFFNIIKNHIPVEIKKNILRHLEF
jgi:hypothetical protein